MANVNINAAEITSVRLKETTVPATPAAGYWKLYAKEGGLYFIDDAGVELGPLGTGATPGGRLTLTTATPVTTADVTAAATLYYTPYTSNMIELYDGARWMPVPFTEKSLDISGYTASKPYDIWGYLSSGTLALDSTVWTDATTRATALAYQNGRYVKTGATTRRYLGTIYINSSGGKTDDSVTKRFVWNYYNRILRSMYKSDTTSHTYNSVTPRSWNNDAAQRVEYICGVLEDSMHWAIQGAHDVVDNQTAIVTIAFDATNSVITSDRMWHRLTGGSAGGNALSSSWSGMGWVKSITSQLSIGYHYLQAVEQSAAGVTITFPEYEMAAGILG